MEALIYSAKNSFKDHFIAFEDEPRSSLSPRNESSRNERKPETVYETVEIRNAVIGKQSRDAPEQPAFHNRSPKPTSKLSAFYSEQDFGEIVPQLKLIRIQSTFSPGRAENAGHLSLNITRSLFNELFDRLQANPWVLWLIGSSYDGYHHIKAQDKYADTYFSGSYQYAIVWTFNAETACTKALLISRTGSSLDSFYAILYTYPPHLFTPYVPMMAMVIDALLEYDSTLDSYLKNVVTVENGTGFMWSGEVAPDLSFNVDELAKWSRVSSNVQINIINLLRHHDSLVRALDSVKDMNDKGILKAPNSKYKADYESSIVEILNSIEILKMRSDSFVPYATYLKNRAEAQISVIFSLLTHEDSVSNLKAAEASMAIAEATKRDSSAMKTIAFMTMAFLPATFLATLFALPVLEWDQKTGVRTNGFQLYWIVAVLSTGFVFVAWALITNWKWIWSRIFKHRKRAARSEKTDD